MSEENLTARIVEATKAVEEARALRNSAEIESIYHPSWIDRYGYWQNEVELRVNLLRELLRQGAQSRQT